MWLWRRESQQQAQGQGQGASLTYTSFSTSVLELVGMEEEEEDDGEWEVGQEQEEAWEGDWIEEGEMEGMDMEEEGEAAYIFDRAAAEAEFFADVLPPQPPPAVVEGHAAGAGGSDGGGRCDATAATGMGDGAAAAKDPVAAFLEASLLGRCIARFGGALVLLVVVGRGGYMFVYICLDSWGTDAQSNQYTYAPPQTEPNQTQIQQSSPPSSSCWPWPSPRGAWPATC